MIHQSNALYYVIFAEMHNEHFTNAHIKSVKYDINKA